MTRFDRLSAPIVAAALCAVGSLCGCRGCEDDAVAPEPPPAVAPPEPAAEIATLRWEPIDPPAAEGAFAAHPTRLGSRVAATWVEPSDDGHRVKLAFLSGDTWGETSTVVESASMFANWADFPAVASGTDGALYAHYARRTGEATYAYAVDVLRSEDDGARWTSLGTAHDDTSDTEHGFVSWIPEGAGVRAFWLDGRDTARDGGSTALRTARIGREITGEEIVDPRVCDCCQTAAAVTDRGPIVAYRDRTDDEVRDIAVVRRGPDGWTEPARVHEDDWRIEGCPVNGPALVADGRRVALAWYTLGDDGGVFVAQSADGGETFSEPARVDEGDSLGRVDVALVADGVVVTWLARVDDETASLRARVVHESGEVARAAHLVELPSSRDTGFPRLVVRGPDAIVTWTEPGEPAHVRAARFPLSELPRDADAMRPEAARPADRAAPARAAVEAFPDVALPDLDGRSVALVSDRPVVVAFFATWCEPCRRELPILSELAARSPDVGFFVVSVDDLPAAELRPLVDAPHLRVLLDDGRVASSLRVPPLPATFVVAPGGRVALEIRGAAADLGQRIERTLAGLRR